MLCWVIFKMISLFTWEFWKQNKHSYFDMKTNENNNNQLSCVVLIGTDAIGRETKQTAAKLVGKCGCLSEEFAGHCHSLLSCVLLPDRGEALEPARSRSDD